MRLKHALLVILAGILILPNLTWSQPGGGRSSGGRGGFDPESMFNRFANGKDVIVVSELDPQMQIGFQFFGQRFGLSGDRITRDQFKDAVTKATAQFTQGASGGGTPGTTGGLGGFAPKGTTGGAPSANVQNNTPQLPGTPSISGGPAWKDRGGDNNPNDMAESEFRRRDKNADGMLAVDELSDTLQRERETWDKNKDGFVDLNEYKEYMTARLAKRDQERQQQQDENAKKDSKDPAVTPEMQQPKTSQEEIRPTVYRAGKLPKDIPEWFIRLDKAGDNDGQVGLWEGKTDPKVMEEFAKYDTNNDGMITAEEILRQKAILAKKAEADGTAKPSRENRDNRDNRDVQTSRDNRDPREARGPGGPPSGGGMPAFGGFGKGGDQGGGQPAFGGFGKGGDGASRFGGGQDPKSGGIGGFGKGDGASRFGGGQDPKSGGLPAFGGFGKGGEQTGGIPRFGGFGKGGDQGAGGEQQPRFGGFGKGGDQGAGGEQQPRFGGFGKGGAPKKK